MENTVVYKQSRLSIKTQTLAALAAAGAAVALPQLVHALGAFSGMGTGLGEMLLPMHLPVMLAGFLAGPLAGALSGLVAPLVSHMLSGMPLAAMLPFMMVELFAYGLCAGLLKRFRLPMLGKVLLTQVVGRALRAVAILVGFYLLGSKIAPAVIWTSIAAGFAGIVLQWAVLPLLTKKAERLMTHEG
ncbi:MAG: ECF transporter S component [Oscillospiraceae bacterium]|nr:ECF transporter S component [Oscillospiraceae bacterium]